MDSGHELTVAPAIVRRETITEMLTDCIFTAGEAPAPTEEAPATAQVAAVASMDAAAPTAPPKTITMSELLVRAELSQLEETLAAESVAEWASLLDADGRQGVLNKLKSLGLGLKDRQKLATTLAKVMRE